MTETKTTPMHKLACALLALVMAIGICVPTAAFAATVTYEGSDAGNGKITIENAQENETYSLYKMLNLSYNETTDSYAYTVTDEWKSFFTEGAGATYFDVDANGYVTIKDGVTLESDSSEMAALAKAALAYAKSSSIDAMLTVTADSEGATFEGLPFGWYLVGTTLGSLCSIDTVNQDVTIDEKNPTPTAEKEVKDSKTDESWTDEDTAEIGDTLSFEVFLKDVAHSTNLCMHDEMSTGIDFTKGSVHVYVGYPAEGVTDLFNDDTTVWTEVSTSETTWTENDSCGDECTFELSFDDSWLDGLNDGAVIKVTYDGVLNENAEQTGEFWDTETNSLHLTYGAQSTSTTVTTTTDTVGFELHKVDGDGETLTGAEFSLYRDAEHTDIVSFVIEDENIYRVATADDVTTTTTIEAGDVSIIGLHEGTYYLVETKAPEGYNMLTSDVVITITATFDATGEVTGETITVDGTTISGTDVDVVNNAGTELPGTGGMGTTIFYIIGGILVVGAVVVLITRRRMSNRA